MQYIFLLSLLIAFCFLLHAVCEYIYMDFCIKQFNFVYLVCLLQVFDLYGVGLRQACSTPTLQNELNLKVTTMQKLDSKVTEIFKPLSNWYSFKSIDMLSVGTSSFISIQMRLGIPMWILGFPIIST